MQICFILLFRKFFNCSSSVYFHISELKHLHQCLRDNFKLAVQI